MSGDQALCRHTVGLTLLLAATALGAVSAAWAVPLPTTRPDVVVELTPDGPEQVVRDTVRAYQPVAVTLGGR